MKSRPFLCRQSQLYSYKVQHRKLHCHSQSDRTFHEQIASFDDSLVEKNDYVFFVSTANRNFLNDKFAECWNIKKILKYTFCANNTSSVNFS